MYAINTIGGPIYEGSHQFNALSYFPFFLIFLSVSDTHFFLSHSHSLHPPLLSYFLSFPFVSQSFYQFSSSNVNVYPGCMHCCGSSYSFYLLRRQFCVPSNSFVENTHKHKQHQHPQHLFLFIKYFSVGK